MVRIGRQNHSVPITDAIFNDLQAFTLGGHSDQILIIGIQEYASSVLGNIVVQFSLGLLHALKTTEPKQVRLADIRDKTIVRLADLHQFLDVIRMIRPHLNDCKLRLGIDVQDRQRHSDVIVQIALRGRDVVLHGQHSRDQFLGGGLAVGSGQSYDSQTFAIHKSVLTMVTCESLQGLQRVRHDNQTGISRSSRCRTFIHHGITCPCLKSFESIFITIEIFAFQSEEHLAAADGTAVRRHTPAFQKCRI